MPCLIAAPTSFLPSFDVKSITVSVTPDKAAFVFSSFTVRSNPVPTAALMSLLPSFAVKSVTVPATFDNAAFVFPSFTVRSSIAPAASLIFSLVRPSFVVESRIAVAFPASSSFLSLPMVRSNAAFTPPMAFSLFFSSLMTSPKPLSRMFSDFDFFFLSESDFLSLASPFSDLSAFSPSLAFSALVSVLSADSFPSAFLSAAASFLAVPAFPSVESASPASSAAVPSASVFSVVSPSFASFFLDS